MKQMLVVKIDRCLGCKTCEVACAIEHSTSRDLVEAIREEPPPRTRVHVVQGARFAVPLQCQQCPDAPCVAVCPEEALKRTAEGPIILDRELCTRCTMCVVVCPFGVITWDPKGRAVVKCDQCYDRVLRGELPACVEACPADALGFQAEDVVLENAFLVQIADEGGA